MVQSIDNGFNRANYSAVKININKPEVFANGANNQNPVVTNPMNVNGNNADLNAVNINIDNPTVTAATFNYRVPYKGVDVPTAVDDNEFLKFETPEATTLAANRQDAVEGSYPTNKNFSKTVYYAIPKNNNNSGLTFHCSFILTNEQTHETIKVQDARVHVKAENCNWEAGKRYIYVFKITKDATGTTGNPGTIIPGDPRPGKPALYPIVFDNIQVEDWTDAFSPANGGNHDIN